MCIYDDLSDQTTVIKTIIKTIVVITPFSSIQLIVFLLNSLSFAGGVSGRIDRRRRVAAIAHAKMLIRTRGAL